MCGFLGEFCFVNHQISDKEKFDDLLLLSKQRGPNNTSTYRKDNYQLGFNRLAILDLSENGNQPKVSPSSRYHIVFNGEIYNYKELSTKHNLKGLESTSDTEVIIHLLDNLGVENTIRELEGMFAIMIVDKEINTVFLTRDFAGIKPLFYGVSKEGLVAASQFDQIFKHSWFNANLKLNKEVTKEYFGFGYMQAPNTVFDSIFQIRPGEILSCTLDGELEKIQINSFDSNQADSYEKDPSLVEIFSNLISKEVANQLMSDVPIASFLSGGIDSPIITALAHQKKENLTAYTVKVEDQTLDESEKAIEYAKHIGVEHRLINISNEILIALINKHFKSFPEPFGDYSSIPTFGITKLARKRHTVMLSGDGGDELFFGYPRMKHIVENKNWFKIPFFIRKPIARVAFKIGLLKTYAPILHKNISDWALGKQLHISLKVLDKFMPKISFSNEMRTLYKNNSKSFKTKDVLYWLRKNEFYGHLQRVLIKVDRASMGNSLEVRVPLLGKHIIKKAFKIIPDGSVNFELKYLLKKIIKNLYPEEIIYKDKKGFSVPIEDWLRNELKEDLKHFVFEVDFYGKEIIDVDEVKLFTQNFLDKKHDSSWGVWQIYAWQKWAYTHVLND